MLVSGISAPSGTTGTTTDFTSDAIDPQGVLSVPLNYIQTVGDTAVQLDSSQDGVAVGWVQDGDMSLLAVAAYVTAYSTAGNMTLTLHADGTAPDGDGFSCNSATVYGSAMTANTDGGVTVGIWDNTGANAEAVGYEAYKLFDHDHSGSNGGRSNAAPSAGAPIYITRDEGAGNSIIIPRYNFRPLNIADVNARAFPASWTFWGSNNASPAPQTDGDWTEITGGDVTAGVYDPGGVSYASSFLSFANNYTTPYRHHRWKVTSRSGANAYFSLGEIDLFSAPSKSAPGTLIASLGTLGSGSAADVWKVLSSLSQALTDGKKYWIQLMGADSADFSLSINKQNENAHAEFPESMETKLTTTGGNEWTSARISGYPAQLNIILNPTTNTCTHLAYLRKNGQYVPIHDGSSAWGLLSIPAEGLLLDCEALSPSTRYNVYAYNNSGDLAIEESTTERARQDGRWVKSGDTTRTWIGAVGVDELQSGYYGPCQVADSMLIENGYQRRHRRIGKEPSYVDTTTASVFGNVPQALKDEHFTIQFIGLSDPIDIDMRLLVVVSYNTLNTDYGVLKNDIFLGPNQGMVENGLYNSVYASGSIMAHNIVLPLGPEYTTLRLAASPPPNTSNYTYVILWTTGAPYRHQNHQFFGFVEC